MREEPATIMRIIEYAEQSREGVAELRSLIDCGPGFVAAVGTRMARRARAALDKWNPPCEADDERVGGIARRNPNMDVELVCEHRVWNRRLRQSPKTVLVEASGKEQA